LRGQPHELPENVYVNGIEYNKIKSFIKSKMVSRERKQMKNAD